MAHCFQSSTFLFTTPHSSHGASPAVSLFTAIPFVLLDTSRSVCVIILSPPNDLMLSLSVTFSIQSAVGIFSHGYTLGTFITIYHFWNLRSKQSTFPAQVLPLRNSSPSSSLRCMTSGLSQCLSPFLSPVLFCLDSTTHYNPQPCFLLPSIIHC